jgi:hypothetical protein
LLRLALLRGNSQVEAQVLRQADRVQLPFHNQSQGVWPMNNQKDSEGAVLFIRMYTRKV